MPCENCNVQFTFLKRKRNCNECSRFYCSQCLDKRNTNIYLCERCVIFTTRPISKVDLLKLKPKDLIFYLQSKHISTAGCVEKEELVNLVLAHVNSGGGQQVPNNEGISGQDPNSATFDNNCSNPFDQFKQSCQNFFTNFTGKISSDLNFEPRTASSNVANVQVNISDQPRVSTRQIPTYASSIHVNPRQQQQHQSSSTSVAINNHNGFGSNSNGTNAYTCNNQNETPSFNNPTTAPNIELRKANVERTNIMRDANSSSSLSSPSSPIISVSSLSSQSISSQTQAARAFDEHFITPHSNNIKSTVPNGNIPSAPVDPNTRRILDEPPLDGSGSGCECSDDEIITKFQTRNRIQKKNGRFSPSSQTDSAFEDQIPGPSGSVPESNSTSKSSTGNQKNSGDSSGSSSFEELGAVGRVSPSDNEHWQFVNKTEMGPSEEAQRTDVGASKAPLQNSEYSKEQTFQFSNITIIPDSSVEGRKRLPRRMIRRRSDSSIYGQRRRESEFSPFPLVSEESDNENVESAHKRQRQSCKKCGKNKRNLEKCIAKFINQLHSTQMSRVDIKQEADAFLVYLQNRKSFDCSDSESNGADADSQNNTKTDSQTPQISMNRSDSIIMEMETGYGNDDGIHVYALNASDYDRHDSRFMNLWDIRTSSEIDELSVKQLKEILMLNRVDYKGCCEKQELLERVHRLWKDSKTSPAVDKLGVDDLCKICMDAPIECVMLECGHMATCTNCGKVLSECPICRQYVVRVVRFFKA